MGVVYIPGAVQEKLEPMLKGPGYEANTILYTLSNVYAYPVPDTGIPSPWYMYTWYTVYTYTRTRGTRTYIAIPRTAFPRHVQGYMHGARGIGPGNLRLNVQQHRSCDGWRSRP